MCIYIYIQIVYWDSTVDLMGWLEIYYKSRRRSVGTQKKWPSLTGKHPVRLLPFPAPRLFVCYKQEMLRVYNCIQLDISCWDVQFGIINRYTNSYISMIPNPLISSHHWAQRTPFIQLAFGGIPQTWTNPSRPYHSVKYPTTSHHIYPHFSFQYIALNPQTKSHQMPCFS